MKYKIGEKELINKLQATELNFKICIAGLAALNCNQIESVLKNNAVKIGGKPYSFNDVKYLFSKENINRDENVKLITQNFISLVLRATVKDVYELIKHYCDSNDKLKGFENASFYPFATLVRNVLSHNMIFDTSGYLFPIKLGDYVEIKNDVEIKNKRIEDVEFMNYSNMIALLDEMYKFVYKIVPITSKIHKTNVY